MKPISVIILLEVAIGIPFIGLVILFGYSRSTYLEWFDPLLLIALSVILSGLFVIGAEVSEPPAIPAAFANRPPTEYLSYRFRMAGAYAAGSGLILLLKSQPEVGLFLVVLGVVVIFIARKKYG